MSTTMVIISMLITSSFAFTPPSLYGNIPTSLRCDRVAITSLNLRQKLSSSGHIDNGLRGIRQEIESDLLSQESGLVENDIIIQPATQFESENDLRPDNANEDTTIMGTQAVFLLNLVAIIWGTQHSVIKMVVEDCDASAFSLARFGLAAIIASPFSPSLRPLLNKVFESKVKPLEGSVDTDSSQHKKGMSDQDTILAWRWGLEMGFWMFLGYAFQAIGLEYTTAQRSGFLLYLNVKFVPFFARILLGRKIAVSTWTSALVAFTGTALLSYGGVDDVLNIGDAWSVAAAAASAMFILRLETATKTVKSSAALNSASLWIVTLIALVWCVCEALNREMMLASDITDNNMLYSAIESTVSNVLHTISLHPFNLLYLGGITTALANYIQTIAQRGVTAERASIIYALDPVYGAIFANLLLGEQLSSFGFVGAGLITFAAGANAYFELGSNEEGAQYSNTTKDR